jgi:predicted nucleic acid-binding protein
MQDHADAIFLTDDAAARLAAVTLGYQVHGSIGILIRAIRRNQLSKDEVLAILKALPNKSTLYVRPSLLENIIEQIEKHTSGSPKRKI